MHRLTRLSLSHPRIAVAILILATAGFATGLPAVHPAFGYRVLVGDDHPAVRRLDDFIERFSGGLPIQIAWECGPGLHCQNAFDEASMRLSDEITSSLQSTSGVGRVTAPSNAPLLVPTAGGFAVRRFFEGRSFAPDAAKLASHAANDPLWTGSLVSSGADAAVITVQPTDSSDATSTQVSLAVETVLEPYQEAGIRFHLVGDPIQNLIVGRDLAESTANTIPFTVLIIALVLFAFCRSIGAVVCALATMGVALVWTFGLLGWLGWPQDGILEVLAPMILVVGVCDAIHLLSRAASMPGGAGAEVRPPEDVAARRQRLVCAAREVGAPATITTVTTAAALGSFVTSDLATFVRFGSIASFGVIVCLLLTFVLLPLMMLVVPERAEREGAVADTWALALSAILAVSQRRAPALLLASLAVLAVCAVGWFLHLRVDHDWTESLGEHSRVVKAQRFMEERLGESSTLELAIQLPNGTSIEDPSTLQRIAALSRRLERIDGLGQARSIVDVIARVGRLLNDDSPDFEMPGGSRAANAEILEIIGFDDPGLLGGWLSFDRTGVRISVGAPEQASSTRARIIEAARKAAEEVLPSDWEILLTGRLAMQLSWIEAVQATQLRSFPTALVLVFAMVAFFLRSSKLALAAMVPTVLPIVITLGAMGWAGLTLDVSRAMVAAVLLGLAVDDAVHILAHYRKRQSLGDGAPEAIRAAVLHSGRAVVTTSFALSLGFLTLMASAWQSIASFGFFVAIAILGALLASLFVLPALIFAFSRSAPPSRDHAGRPTGAAKLAAIGLVSPVVLAVVISLASSSSVGSRSWESPCWVLPAGHVLTVPGAGECPLQLLDQIRSVGRAGREQVTTRAGSEVRTAISRSGPQASMTILRRGEEHAADLPLNESTPLRRGTRVATASTLAAGLLALPILLTLHARSRAAIPLGIFYASISVVLVAAIGGQQSLAMNLCAILALATAPAALVQLGMVFPAESKLLRQTPHLYAAPYLATIVLAAIACVALLRAPVLWPSFIYLVLVLCGAAWLILILACAFAVRESPSAAARARAGFVCIAGVLLPGILVVPLTWGSSAAQIGAAYLWASALLVPLPIGFAISRYNLFDIGWPARHGVGRSVYFVSAALVATALVHVTTALLDTRPVGSEVILATSLGCLLVAEALRRPLLGFLEAALSPRSQDLRTLRELCSQALSRLSGEHEIARLLLRTLQDGVGTHSGWVLLRHGSEWESAETIGEMEAPAASVADTAAARVAGKAVEPLDDGDLLQGAGVHVIAALAHGDEQLGLILLGRSNLAVSGIDLDFIGSVASYAAIAIHNSRLADERAAIEGQATTSRVAVELMHDMGKDLGWMRGLASRLTTRTPDDARLQRAATQIADLADSLIHTMREFVADATSPRKDPPAITRLDELMDRSLRELRTRFGDDRIHLTHDPTTRGLRCHENVGHVVRNLVDDAIRASSLMDPVRVSATLCPDGRMLISVVDRPPVCSTVRVESASQPGAAKRRRSARTAVCLAAQNMTEALGGKLELSRTSEGGGRAEVRLPIPQSWRPS